MNDTLKIWLGIGLALVIGVGSFFYGGDQGPAGPSGSNGANGTSLGAVAGPDIMSPYFSYGGVRHWGYSADFNQASTTLCDFTSPAGTSTLVYAGATARTGTTTTIAVEIGKSANPTATTTRLAYRTGAAGQWTVTANTASTTATGGSSGSTYTIEPDYVFAGSQRLVFKYGGAQGALNVLVGSCKAVFVEHNPS